MKISGQPVPPCMPDGKPCELRGSSVCHTADCPYGWGEYEKLNAIRREKNHEERTRERLVPVGGKKGQW